MCHNLQPFCEIVLRNYFPGRDIKPYGHGLEEYLDCLISEKFKE